MWLQTWRPTTRQYNYAQSQSDSKHYRRLTGKVDSAWARAILAEGMTDETRAVVLTRLSHLQRHAVEASEWKLVAARQAAANGWKTDPANGQGLQVQEHRRLVAVRLEHVSSQTIAGDCL